MSTKPSRTASAAGGAAAVVGETAGNDERDFGPHAADACGGDAVSCDNASDIVREFVRRTTCGAAMETNGVFGSAVATICWLDWRLYWSLYALPQKSTRRTHTAPRCVVTSLSRSRFSGLNMARPGLSS